MTSIGFYLSGVIAVGIIFIGCRFLLTPATAAAAYGVPAGAEPHSRAYLSAKGIRDIASGLFIAMLIAYGSAHALGWFMLIATLMPIADAVIVLHAVFRGSNCCGWQRHRACVAVASHAGVAGSPSYQNRRSPYKRRCAAWPKRWIVPIGRSAYALACPAR